MMNGTDKQLAWAETIRAEVLRQYDAEQAKRTALFVEYSCDWADEVKAAHGARTEQIAAGRALAEATDDAQWWINYRGTRASMSYFNLKAAQKPAY